MILTVRVLLGGVVSRPFATIMNPALPGTSLEDHERGRREGEWTQSDPSDVMLDTLMTMPTHSCVVGLAYEAIRAFGGVWRRHLGI